MSDRMCASIYCNEGEERHVVIKNSFKKTVILELLYIGVMISITIMIDNSELSLRFEFFKTGKDSQKHR